MIAEFFIYNTGDSGR